MDIHAMVQEGIGKALEAESQRLLDELCQMRPIYTHTFTFTDDAIQYGSAALRDYEEKHIIDSTAIVIDEDVKALPEPPKKGRRA